MSYKNGPTIVSSGLVLYLDAANPKSYTSGSTTWKDLSGNGYDFSILASTWVNLGSQSHMNFESAIAKRVVGGVLTNVPNFTNGTFCIFSTIKAPNGDWKTLTRGASSDHQVIVQASDGITLGMYDNDVGGFISAGVDVSTTIPNRTTQFNYMCWKLSQSSPYYQFFYNTNLSSAVGTITNANATFNNGFASIGAYHSGNTNLTSFGQGWGKISLFLYYNRQLSSSELLQNYNATKGRFGLL